MAYMEIIIFGLKTLFASILPISQLLADDGVKMKPLSRYTEKGEPCLHDLKEIYPEY